MNLSAPSHNIKELQAQTELFKKLKKEHDKQIKDIFEGQEIAKLRDQAKKMLEEAKKEAAIIVAKAEADVEKNKEMLKANDQLKQQAMEQKAFLEGLKEQELKRKSEIDQREMKAVNFAAELEVLVAQAEEEKDRAKSKLGELKELLERFCVSLN